MSSSTGRPYAFDPYAPETRGATAAPSATSSGTTGVAKDQAAGVASDAADAGKHVAGTAKAQASDVVGEARTQAKDLLAQTRTQLTEQTTAGQQRAATGLGALAGELADLAEGKGGDGLATDLAHQASQRLDAVASWLGDREPADLLRDVQGFARRRPVAFLAIAAGAGLVAGRLTRGIAAATHDANTSSKPTSATTTAGQASQRWTAPSAPTANADQAQVTGTTDPVYGTTPAYGAAPTDSTTGMTTSLAAGQGWDLRR